MAVIHTERKRLKLAAPFVISATVAAGFGVWWFQQTSTPTSVTPAAPAVSTAAAEPAVQVAGSASAPMADSPTSPEVIEKLAQEQKQTAKSIEDQPQLKPIKGLVSERPSFISEMEWSVFKSVAMQQRDPDKALTALVNKVRFFKQLEVLQDMPATADKAKRQVLAKELLDDLPERLKNGDYDQAGASQLLNQLAADAEPDQIRRKALSSRMSKMLQDIQTQAAQAVAAAASATDTQDPANTR
jgi:hypothetical protein